MKKVLEKMKNLLEKAKKHKKKFLGLLIFIVLALIVALVLSLIFNDKKVEINGLNVTYIEGDVIKVKKVTDEYSYIKEVTIENTNKESVTYSLHWKDVKNTFKTQSNLLYEIVPTAGTEAALGTSQIPVASSKVFSSVVIMPGDIHKYEIRITYKGNSSEEKDNYFEGRVLIDSKKYKDESLELEKELEKQMEEEMEKELEKDKPKI